MGVTITNRGLRKMIGAFAPDEIFEATHLVFTDDPTAPTANDTMAEFCDVGSGYQRKQKRITNWGRQKDEMVFNASVSLYECNITWAKVGLVDRDGTLLAVDDLGAGAISKTNTKQYTYEFKLRLVP